MHQRTISEIPKHTTPMLLLAYMYNILTEYFWNPNGIVGLLLSDPIIILI